MKFFKSLFTAASIALGSMFLSTQGAYAAVPEEVTTALTAAKTDGVSVAGIVLTIVIAIAAFKYIRRAL